VEQVRKIPWRETILGPLTKHSNQTNIHNLVTKVTTKAVVMSVTMHS